MPTKLQFYQTVAERTLADLTTEHTNWTKFLDTAARLYKYPFHDQLMIFAQRPNIVACAELEFWNEQFDRWVRRGAKGIALIDDNGSYPRLKYVFDVADTEPSRDNARPVKLWEMLPEHEKLILTEFAKNYDEVSADDPLYEAIHNIAIQLASEYYGDNANEILAQSEYNPYDDYDDNEAFREAFEQALALSTAYTVMVRCGIDPYEYVSESDIQEITAFNTPETISALGVASSSLSEQVLRDVEITIRKYERVKNAERSEQDYDRNTYLQPSRGLSASRPEAQRAAEGTDRTARQVRTDEENVPQGSQADNVQPVAAHGEPIPASEGSGRSSDSEDVAGDGSVDGAERTARQSGRADGMGSGDERAESTGGGNGTPRTDLQLNETEAPSGEGGVSLSGDFSADTFSQLGKSSIEAILSTSRVSLAEVDSILRDGGNFNNHMLSAMPFHSRSALRIAARFTKDLGAEENARFLKGEFLAEWRGSDYTESGKGFDFGNHRVCAWYDVEGITLAIGVTAKNNIHSVTIPWEDAAARVDELMRDGQYISRAAFDNALDNERRELAKRIWSLYRDDMGGIPDNYKGESRGCPGDTAVITTLLEDADERQEILERLESDVNEWSYNNDKPRSWNNPYHLLDDMNNAMHPPVILPNDDFSHIRNFSYFITQDEIDALITKGGNYHEGKFRFFSFFLGDHDDKEKLSFVKREYGHGGGTWSQTDGWHNAEPGKGLTLKRGDLSDDTAEVKLKWNAVIKRTEQLINEGMYMTRTELDSLPNYERLMLIRKINNFYYELPDEYERPLHVRTWQNYVNTSREDMEKLLDFTYPREAEWRAIRDLLDNPERVSEIFAQMQHIFENTSPDDRYYLTRKTGYEALAAYCDGTYTLFPGIENLPSPETVKARLAARKIVVPSTPRRGMIEDLSGPSLFSYQDGVPPEIEQMSMFDNPAMPILPSADEQHQKIDQRLMQEAEQAEKEAEVDKTPALSLPIAQDEIDILLMSISDTDKTRITEQFADNPRSREAVMLVREIYGSIEETVGRIDGEDGYLGILGESTGVAIVRGAPASVPLSERPPAETLALPWSAVQKRIMELAESGGFDANIDPYTMFEDVREELSERGFAVSGELVEDGINEHYSNGGRGNFQDVADFIENEYLTEEPESIEEPPHTEPKPTKPETESTEAFEQPEAPQHDFGSIADEIYKEVLNDGEFAETLANAASRGELRGTLNSALNSVIAGYESDPQMFGYLSNDDVADDLFDYIYRRAWDERESEPETLPEQQFTEITDPAVIAEVEAIFGDKQPQVIADRVYEETLPNGEGTTAYYLFHSPDGIDAPAPLAHETLPLIKEQADTYIICADTCHLSESEMSEWGIGFRKMPRDWNLLPEAVQEKIRHIKPEYGRQQFFITPPPVFFVDWNEAQYDIDLNLYRDKDVIGYDKDGKKYAMGRSGGLDYVTTTGALWGSNEVPGDIFEQINAYKDGNQTNEEVRTNYLSILEVFKSYRAADLERYDYDVLADVLTNRLFAEDGKDIVLTMLNTNRPNQTIAANLANMFDETDTVILTNGEPANYTAYRIGLNIETNDNSGKILRYSWDEVAAVIRALESQWSMEREAARRVTNEQEEDVLLAAEQPDVVADTLQPIKSLLDHVPKVKGIDYRITDDALGEGGPKTKFRNNINALQTLKNIENYNLAATPEEQEILARYVGWGGIQQAFDPDNKDWANEHQELKDLLTQDEWESARASVLNAHYTSPTVIKAIYETVDRLGFRTGNILEPSCGVGNFLGLLPEAMRDSKLYGVELDSVTARIAQHLYPNADIRQTGYENADFSDAFFDIAIGNVPFGTYGVIDKRYKTDFRIHDYFFQKTIDKVRPGGIIAFLTTKGTLDKQNPEVRKYIAQRAELLGAVRLPNNAFLKNAGTEATADIIFLQKRDRPIDNEPEWVHLGMTEDGLPLNRYFLDNPEMLLGTMANDTGVRMYGSETYTTCVPIEGANLADQLDVALSFIEGQYTVDELDDLDGIDNNAIPADPNVKNFSYTDVDGTVYFRENSLMYPVELPAMTLNRIQGMIGLRECVQKLIALQLDDYSDAEIKAQQAELSFRYDNFIAEYGLISSQANSRAFNADSAYYLLSSLEVLDENGDLERKADMFTTRTIRQNLVITHVDTASEALAVSLGEKARVDLLYMQNLCGLDMDVMIKQLEGVIFKVPKYGEPEWVTADEYLSGNVREKLKVAQDFVVENQDEYTVNVAALESVQPKDLEAGEISVRLGSTWIDAGYVQEFMYNLLDTMYYNKDVYQVKYHELSGEWQVTGKGRAQYSDINATVTYGTSRMNAYQILDDTLNLRDVRVYDMKEDDEGRIKRVLNKKETMLAQQKQELIKQKFRDWIWADPERRQTLVDKYNTMFNSVRPREYDGSHIVFSGMNPEIKLSKHQVDGVARQMYGGNTLYAHVVGAGKTFTMVASAMEGKRLGLCQKSLFSVPNHLTEQWAAEFMRLYPSANILVATKRDFEMRNRKKFCAKIATGDYDAVITGHSQLEKIPMSRERQERMIREQIWGIEEGLRELKASNGERFSIKQLEKTRKSLEVKLTKLLDSKKRDDVVTYEQLGVDRLYVDEAHNFKNLFLYTKMRNVAGLSTTEAQKSSDLYMKCRYMDEITGNKGVIFATGTPISNSMSEMYTMQRYLQYDTLEEKRLTHFDAWASIFGETVTSIELAPEGTGYRARTRFAKFHNLPELMSIFKEVADIQTADMLNLPVPDAVYENIIVEPSELQQEMVEELSSRAAKVHARLVEPNVDNMLKITTDGRKIGLDQRLMNPILPDHEGSKVNACMDKVFEIWNDTRNDRLTQLVFCDFSTPNKDGRFNVYDDIRVKLLERGIPEHEIAFIHDADTETRKKELFAKVRQGKVRVLFGSTFKMGAGTNVQDRLIAIHDADCPWRPADLEQRSGRIIRQGNMNPEVQIYRYATSGTFDSYLWQTVQKKQEFIAQIISSKSPVRSCEDVDETALSYAEIKALCAGNPLIAEKMNLDNEVAKLRMLKSEHKSQHYRLEDDLLKRFPEQIASAKERIAGIEKDIAAYAAEKDKHDGMLFTNAGSVSPSSKFPGMTINGVEYAEKEPAAKALLDACKSIKGSKTDISIGEYMGFAMSLQYDSFGQQVNVLLRDTMTYKVDLGDDALGNMTRINNALDKLPERLEGAKSQLGNLNRQVEAAKLELSNPFEQEAELAEKEARLALLNADLNIDGDGGLEVQNDRENSNDDFVSQIGNALDEMGIKYTRDYDPHAENDGGFDESAGAQSNLASARVSAVAANKAKPSILDGIRNFDSSRHNSSHGKDNAPERGI